MLCNVVILLCMSHIQARSDADDAKVTINVRVKNTPMVLVVARGLYMIGLVSGIRVCSRWLTVGGG